MIEFNAGSMLYQLERAITRPQNYHGEAAPLYRDATLLASKLGTPLPDLEELRRTPATIETIWHQLSLLCGDKVALVRLGKVGTCLSLIAYRQDLRTAHPLNILAAEMRDLLGDIGASNGQINEWLNLVQDEPDRASVMTSLSALVVRLNKEPKSSASSDVFISYSANDTDVAEDIAHLLHKMSFSVFLAHQTISIGPAWEEQVAAAARGCRLAVLVLSDHSRNSDWVRYEIGALWALGKPVAPALVELQTKELPELLRKYQGRQASTHSHRIAFCQEIARLMNDNSFAPNKAVNPSGGS